MADSVNQIINENLDLRKEMAPKAVLSQVVLMSVISVVTVITFNILRPQNKIVYQPKVKYHEGDKEPPKISSSPFGWIPPLIHTKEAELVDKIGLDAVTFLRFLRMCRSLFSSIALLLCAVLIPVNVVYTLKHEAADTRDDLSMLTIRDVQGNILSVHVAMSYLITGLVMFFIYINWVQMVRLRRAWFRSPEYAKSFYARTLAIMQVPKKLQSDEGIKAIFQSVQVPYPTTSVHINRRVARLPELIEFHNNAVRELEHIMVRYLKGGKIAKERPTLRIGGFMGMGGKKVDAIEFYTNKLKRTEGAIENYREMTDSRKAENYGFASMASVPYAHIVANMLKNKHPKGTTITLAPNPKDIIWENMDKTHGELMRKRFVGFIYLSLIAFFNTVPLFIISVLANLSSLQDAVPFINTWASNSPETFAIVSGVLPPAVSGFFGFFLPRVVRWLSQYQGDLTQTKLDRSVVGRYYSFLIISQLIVFTLIGVMFNVIRNLIAEANEKESLAEIWANLHTLPGDINTTYIDQASYWLTYFPLRGFLVFFDLAQILNVVWTSFKKNMFGRTPRDVREWTKPTDFEFAIYYTNILFMATVALVFAPLAPLVAAGAAVVFWISSWVYKYQLMYVCTTKVESGGRLWNVIINRMLVATIMMQLLFALTIGLQGPGGFKSFFWVSTIPPIFFVLAFKIFLNRKFNNAFYYYQPTEAELHDVTTHSERADNKGNRLEKRFGHPSLHAELFTPMLYKEMMPLLREIYKGRMDRDDTRLAEYGGQKVEAQVVSAGIKFAAIDEHNLEYDPQLYARDRGELDWDARSIASTDMLGNDGTSLGPSKSMFYANGRSSPAPGLPQNSVYNQYMAHGPGHHSNQSEIEMSAIGPSTDHLPLLASQKGYFNGGTPPPPAAPYQQSPRGSPGGSPRTQYPPAPSYRNENDGYREAPIHRPSPHPRQASNFSSQGGRASPAHSRDTSRYSQISAGPPNMAGRGTFRG